MLLFYFIYSIASILHNENQSPSLNIYGAWKDDNGVLIITQEYYSYTAFTSAEFQFTYGGSWNQEDNRIAFEYEYHTKMPEKIGTTDNLEIRMLNGILYLDNIKYTQLDDGSPGKLEGAWLFYNRIRDGEKGIPRLANNPRKTMKILSGTRFQWIAYDTETKSFSGTGGGSYTTIDGTYTENIDFFSRDNNRIGVSLEFDYEVQGDEWHHSGLNSRGEPLYEIWKRR